MTLSLRWRMVLAAVLPATLVAFLLTGIFVYQGLRDLESGLQARGSAVARQLATSSEFPLFSGNRESISALADATLRADSDIAGVAVIDGVGTLVARVGLTNPVLWHDLGVSEYVRVFPDTIVFVNPVLSSRVAVDDIYAGTEAPPDSRRTVLGHVAIEMSPRGIVAQRNRLISAGILAGLFGALLGTALARVIARGVSRTLIDIAEVVERVGRGDAGARVNVADSAPLQRLAHGINDMAARVGETQEQLRTKISIATAELLQQKDTAERATAAKSQFLAAASHDLRQPLHALGLFVSALMRTEAARGEPALLKHIESSVTALQNLFDAILDISRLDSGQVSPRLCSIAVNEIFDRLRHDLMPVAAERQLQLKLRPTPMRIRGDRQMVERIVLNMITNAIRYSERGGVLVGCRERAGKAVIEVWDTGQGIAAADLPEIFYEYVQLNNPERDRAKGQGLGLAICQRLATLMGGRVGVRSREGRGSVFWLELPLAGVELDHAGLGDDAPSSAALVARDVTDSMRDALRLDGRVVVVEDDPLIRIAMEQLMRGWGLHVRSVERAEEIGRLLVSGELECVDVAICDIRLPGPMNGVELAQMLQRTCPTLKVLLVSADVTEQIRRTAQQSGFPLLKKPVAPGRLRAAIGHLLQPAEPEPPEA